MPVSVSKFDVVKFGTKAEKDTLLTFRPSDDQKDQWERPPRTKSRNMPAIYKENWKAHNVFHKNHQLTISAAFRRWNQIFQEHSEYEWR